jgi:DNA-binding Xre family transcriptional regulator
VCQEMIKWKLAELMARHRIKAKDLAIQLEINPTAVSNLKSARTMPRFDGDRLSQLLTALNQLADKKTIESPIGLLDLLEYVADANSETFI